MKYEWVKKISADDLQAVVNLHFQALTESLLNNFSRQFVQIAYQSLINNPANLSLLVKKNDHVVGYLIVLFNASSQIRKIAADNLFVFVKEGIKAVSRTPSLLIKAIDAKALFEPHDPETGPELKFIAVDENFRSKGIGTKMLSVLSKKLSQMEVEHYCLATKKDNRLSNKFYINNHFIFLHQREVFGDVFNYYRSP